MKKSKVYVEKIKGDFTKFNLKTFKEKIIAIFVIIIFLMQYMVVPSCATAEEGHFTAEECPYNIKLKKVSAENYTTAAIDSKGNIWTWGKNEYGKLGDGTTNDSSVPKQVTSGIDFVEVEVGVGSHCIALDYTGNIWAWGNNGSGQLGDGTTTNVLKPKQITSGKKFREIRAGGNHTLAIDEDGNIWAWGDNAYGQLGSGTEHNYVAIPIQVTNETTFVDIEVGLNHSVAIDSNGNVWSWGMGSMFIAGDGTQDNSYVPKQITNETQFIKISSGIYYFLLIDTNGNIWTWGHHRFGSSGNGTENINIKVPTQITTGKEFREISSGEYDNMAIDKEGKLWGWGNNSHGQLGNGTTNHLYTLTLLSTKSKVIEMSLGRRP